MAQKTKKSVRRTIKKGGKIPFIVKALCVMEAPMAFIQLVVMISNMYELLGKPLQLVEYFAGQKAVTKAALRHGRRAVGFEINDDSSMDWMSPAGFLQMTLWIC